MRVLSASEMRAVDRRLIEEIGIPSLVLMENAALGVVEALAERFPRARRVAIFCGPGNNGADGLAILRQLATRGYDASAVLLAGGRPLSEEAEQQLAICRRLELAVTEAGDEGALADLVAEAAAADLALDALFGTGLTRPLEGLFAAAVAGINALPCPVLAVDLPSGLDASTGALPGPHVVAALTVTFAAPKVAHLLRPAEGAVGELAVADLGVPPELIDEAPGDLHALTAEEAADLLPPRAPDSHKGSHGHLLIVAGGPGRAGAAILAARAAVRAGAGLVTAAVPAPLLATVDLGSLESMTLALPAGPEGELAAAAAAAALAALAGKSALALGPGLGTSPAAAAAIRDIALEAELPLVLDADGLNAFAGRLEELAARVAPAVLTPHPGEMARLLGVSSAEVQADRLAAARRAAELSGAVVVLKGYRTLTAATGRGVWINLTGGPALATGGSGDVLAGMIAALLAQGLAAPEAAMLGAFLHGLCGDLAAAAERGLCAGDLIEALPLAFSRLAAP